jgi:hypothetical protein
MRVKAIQKHVYKMQDRKTYEEYEMDDQDVPIMEILGHIMKLDTKDVSPAEPKKYRRRDMKADA